MTTKFDPAEFGRFVGRRTKELIETALAPIREQLKALPSLTEQVIRLDERIKSMPVPKDGRDGVDGKDGINGKDGASVTVDDVRPLIELAIKSLPVPKDGKDGKDGINGKDGTSVTVDDVWPMIDKAMKSLPVPKDGRDGTSVSIEDVQPLIDRAVKAAAPVQIVNEFDPALVGKFLDTVEGARVLATIISRAAEAAVKELPVPKDGKDGTNVSVDEVLPVLEQMVKSLPLPKDGRDGVDGKDGKDGRDGIDGRSVPVEEVKAMVDSAVELAHEVLKGRIDARIKELPVPKDGKDGRDGINGKDGRDGVTLAEVLPAITEAVKSLPLPTPQPGKDGKDGTSVTVDEVLAKLLPAINERIELVVTKAVVEFERRAQDMTREAIKMLPVPKDGKDGINGKDGADGKDGLSFDDFDVEYDGERTIKLLVASSGVVKEAALHLPIPLHRGIYDEKQKYERADEVTFGGSTWRAMRDMPAGKPGSSDESITGWRLITKRGRDGQDAGKKG